MTKPLSTQDVNLSEKPKRTKKQIIIEAIIKDIARGTLRRGAKVPNRKSLAKRFGVNVKTVDSAVSVLLDRKVLYTERGRGTFVNHTALLESDSFYDDRFFKKKRTKFEKLIKRNTCFQLGSQEVNPLYFLANCMKSISTLTHRLINQPPEKWMQFYRFGEKLSHLMREDLSVREGKYYKESNFMVLTGRYHTLKSIMHLILKEGDVIVVSAVVSPGIFALLTQLKVKIWSLPPTGKGISATKLKGLYKEAEKRNERIVMVYTNLQVDYTEGVTREIVKSMGDLLKCTEELGLVLLEEYEDHEISYQKQITFSDIASTAMGHVISVRSFSKLLPMYNELRMVLAPMSLIESLQFAKLTEGNYGSLYEKLAIRILQKNIFSQVAAPVSFHFKNVRDGLIAYCEKKMKNWVDILKPSSGCVLLLIAKADYEFLIPLERLRDIQLYYNNFNGAAKNEKITTRYLQIGFGEGNSRNIELALEYIVEEMLIRYPSEDVSTDKSE